jgi:SWI/SNF-related matrix-associated actin-dependent regulator 1 of chromatin subfamily A
MESGAKKVLIICPASLKINWQREIENYSDKKVLIVEGKKWGSTFDYYIINYDIIKNYHSMESVALGEEIRQPILKEKFDLVIIDEAHMISNPTANRTKLINDIVEKIPKVWLLSGTPMTSRPINYYNILKIVNSPIALNWQSYVKRYCGGYQFTVNGKKIWNTGGATNLDELRERTKNLVLRRMKTDILDLPDKIITPIFLDLKSTFYDEELEDFMRITNENKNKESLSITINRLMKVRQVIAYEKVEYTSEIIDRCLEQGKKVIVFTNFTMTLDMLHEKYKKNSVVLDGRMSKEKRQQSVDRFQSEDKVKIFISNIIAGGVGITLTEAEVVIMNDLSFVPAHHSQAEDRAFRYGQKKNVMVYYPIFENTMEKIVYNILNKKKNIIDQVMGDGDFSESFATSLLKELV